MASQEFIFLKASLVFFCSFGNLPFSPEGEVSMNSSMPSWAAKNGRPPAKLINESKAKAALCGRLQNVWWFQGENPTDASFYTAVTGCVTEQINIQASVSSSANQE